MGFDIDLLGPPEKDETSLAHYGVKGMRWGVRKRDETGSGRSATLEDYTSISYPKPSIKAQTQARQLNEAKSIAKTMDPMPSDPVKGLTPGQKRAMYIAGGGLAAAAIIGGAYYTSQQRNVGLDVLKERALKDQERLGNLTTDYRKKAWDPNNPGASFENMVEHSKYYSWSSPPAGYVQPQSWTRPEFEIPAGTMFNRVSQSDEKIWRDITYVTHTPDDAKRYVANYTKNFSVRANGPIRQVSAESKDSIRVPNLLTTVETLRETMSANSGKKVSPAQALETYQRLSGTAWDRPEAAGFFDALKAKGYGAIVDEMDAGVIGETPLVLFSPGKMGSKTTAPLTEQLMTEAWNTVTDFDSRKP